MERPDEVIGVRGTQCVVCYAVRLSGQEVWKRNGTIYVPEFSHTVCPKCQPSEEEKRKGRERAQARFATKSVSP